MNLLCGIEAAIDALPLFLFAGVAVPLSSAAQAASGELVPLSGWDNVSWQIAVAPTVAAQDGRMRPLMYLPGRERCCRREIASLKARRV
ncbi:MAG: hypothetical protein P4L33_19955 [Capsulimonadaceae bacterium]|nr:hypothetical protein [Capsulimonadaceae bacterium]